mgnify:CR=1 FL=1
MKKLENLHSTDAENLLKTIRKYEKVLKEGKVQNLELINSILSNYRNIYYDILNTAKMLEARAKEEQNAA